MRCTQLGHTTDRIGHARQLVERLARGDRWDLVFNICEGLHGIGREAQVPAILDVYDIPYTFSDPAVMAPCAAQGLTKTVVREAGVPTPDSRWSSGSADLDRCRPAVSRVRQAGRRRNRQGHRRRVESVTTRRALARVCRDLLRHGFGSRCWSRRFLPGREFTVGLVGTGDAAEVIGGRGNRACGRAEPEVYSYVNKEQCEERVDYTFLRGSDDATSSPRPSRSHWRPGGPSAAATPAASTSAATRRASRSSSKSIRSPACTRSIPICR